VIEFENSRKKEENVKNVLSRENHGFDSKERKDRIKGLCT
jgi:hypothetical protein